MKKLYKSLFAGIALMGLSASAGAQCTWTLDQTDSWGDGWNNNQLSISINGTATNYTLANGSTGQELITVNDGDVIVVEYLGGGSFNNEVGFTLSDQNSAVLASANGPATIIYWQGGSSCDVPGCAAATALALVDSTQTSIDLSWETDATATDWVLVYGATPSTISGGTVLNLSLADVTLTGTTATYTLPGLAYSTFYDIAVAMDCGASDNGHYSIGSFGTVNPCPDVSGITASWLDNDSVGVTWTAGGSEVDWNIELGAVGFVPNTGAEIYAGNVSSADDTIGGLVQLTDYEIYVSGDCGGGFTSSWVGPITFTTLPNCPDVSGLTLDYVTADSLVVSWTSNGSEVMWDMEYGPAGYVPGAGTLSTVTSTVDTVGGLMPEVSYDVYVRSDCGGVDQGVWIGPLNVLTSCDPVTAFPYVEDFEGAYPGWRVIGATTTWDIGVPAGNVITSAANGNNAAVTNLTGNYNNSENGFLLTACFDFTALTNPVMTFNLNYDTENGWDEGWVDVTTNEGATWTRLGTATSGYSNWYNDPANNWWEASSGGWVVAAHPLAAYAGMSNVRFRIAFSSDGSVNGFDGIGVDDFMIVDEPCARPTDFAVVSVITDTLVVGWTAGGTETSWNIEYGPTGFTPGMGTSYSTTNNPDTITGLADGSVFDFYITADCGGGSESVLLSPVLIATPLVNDLACDAVQVNVDATTNTFSNFGATSDVGEIVIGTGNTVWFKAVVPASGHFAIATCGSLVRTEMVIYDSIPDCSDLSTATSSQQSTGGNPFGCGFGYSGLEVCDKTAGDTVYFTIDSYSFGDGQGIFDLVLFDLEYEAGTGGVVDACAGDTVNLEAYNSGSVSLFPGYWDYPANPNVVFDDSLANTANFTLGAADALYIVSNSCMQDTAIVTVNVSAAANAGIAIDPFNGCNTGDVFLMDGLTGTIDAGGTWTDDLSTGLLVGGVFVANGLPVGQYQFTYIADNGACPEVSTQVTVELANCVGVEENTATFNLFPNPNNGSFFITSSVSDIANITIMDAQGKLISTQQVNLQAGLQSKLEMNSVESGLYMISVQIADSVSTQTFIVK